MTEPPRTNGDPELAAQASVDQMTSFVANLNEADRNDLAAKVVREALHGEAKNVAAAEAVRTAVGEDAKQEVITAAVRAASPEAKKVAAAEAVSTAPDVNKQDVAVEAIRSLPSDEAREKVASQFLPPPTQPVTDEIWLTVVSTFKWVLWGATVALVAAIGVALFREVDIAYIQILLTVFTTVAGVFAGFITGQFAGRSTGGGSTGR
jgi:hypothetical protein